MKAYWVYILCSQRNGTLYVGVTNNLSRRVYEHKQLKGDGFTTKYNVTKLVYYDEFQYVNDAIQAEKRIKKWNRKWKIELIEKHNPEWEDLYERSF